MPKGITETETYFLFWGGWPSQWAKASFTIDATTYNCCEQFMMAEKARVFGDEGTLSKILAVANPGKQKALGRQVKNFDPDVWNNVCRGIVYTGNLARFSQDGSSRHALLATGEKTIVEASPVDRIWGIGLTPDDPKAQDESQWRGTNWLGIALMQVRATLRGSVAIDGELKRQLERRAMEIRGSAYEQ